MKRPNGRNYTREMRQEEAFRRQEERIKLTPQQQLDILDQRLGPDTGAMKERYRLLRAIADESQNTRTKRNKKNVKNSKA